MVGDHRRRTLIALAAAALSGTAFAAITLGVTFTFGDGSGPPTATKLLEYISYIGAFSLPACLLAGLLIGLPWHFLARRLGMTAWIFYVVAGAVGGWALYRSVLEWWPPTTEDLKDAAFAVVHFVATGTGAVMGLAFWLIRRPDRDEPTLSR